MTFLEQTSDAIELAPAAPVLPLSTPGSTPARGPERTAAAPAVPVGPVVPVAGPTVVVVDAHAAVRAGLPLLLAPEGIDVVGTAAGGIEAEQLIARLEPDVALVSIETGDAAAAALLQRLVGGGLRTAIVLYADADDGAQAAVAVHSGAAGVVAKRRTVAELCDVLRTIAGGGVWFNESGLEETADAFGTATGAPRRTPSLTLAPGGTRRRTALLSDSELRVLALVAEGSSTESMAGTLSLSPHTVRTHLRNVMRKLEASSRAHAVAIAIREAAIKL